MAGAKGGVEKGGRGGEDFFDMVLLGFIWFYEVFFVEVLV